MKIENILEIYFPNLKIKNFIDIGAGTGQHTKEVYKYCNGNPYILEGDAENNYLKNKEAKKVKWNSSADDFNYYHTFTKLKDHHAQHFPQAILIDCDNIQLPEDLKFDLIFSHASYGYHYPISTYYDFIQKHSHKDTLIIVDIRNFKNQIKTDECFKIVKTYAKNRKWHRCLIELV